MAITTAKRKQRGSVGMLARGPEVLVPADGECEFCGPLLRPCVSAETSALVGLQVVEIPVDKIHRRPSNRGGVAVAFLDVAELVESIEAFGLSRPVEVRDTSEEQELPVGHFELTKGERRWTAFRALRRGMIPAIVRVGLDAAAAAVQVAIDNTHAQALDPVQRAQSIRDAIATGLTLADAAKAHGLGESAGKNAIRLLDLPAKIRAAVAEGRLAERTARYLIPYTAVSGVMGAVEKSLGGKSGSQQWWLERTCTEEQVKHGVRQLVDGLTRPVDGKTKHYYGWQEGTHPCYFHKVIDASLRQELGVVEIRVDNKPIEVATNVKRFDELNQVEMEKRKAAKKAKEKAGTNGKAGKPGAPNADAVRKQDDSLARNVHEWRHRFLRQSIARALKPGCAYSEKVAFWVITQVTQAFHASMDFGQWLSAIAELRGVPANELANVGSFGNKGLTWWGLVDRLTPDWEDPVSDLERVRCELAQYLLWPVAAAPLADDCCARDVLVGPGELPERIPGCDCDEIEDIAEYLGHGPDPGYATKFAAAWDRARHAGPERQMFVKLLEYPNKRQLQGWCEEWGIWDQVRGWKTLTAQAEGVCEMHGEVAKGLKMLKCLERVT